MPHTDFDLTLAGKIATPNPIHTKVVSVGLGAVVTSVEIKKPDISVGILDIYTSGRTVTLRYRGRGPLDKIYSVPCTLRVHWDPVTTSENTGSKD